MRQIDLLIKDAGLTQQEGAKRMNISQPDVSRLLRGQFRDFSLERLMRFITALGQNVQIAVTAPARPRKRGKLSVAAMAE